MISQSLEQFFHNLAKVIGGTVTTIDLSAIIDTALRTEPVRESKDVYYASHLPYMCDVREAFKRVDNMWKEPAETDPASLKLMALGSAVHALTQNKLLAQNNVLWGTWRCRSCGMRIEHSFRPALCTNTVKTTTLIGDSVESTCATRFKKHEDRWEYEELSLVCDAKNIRGRCDGIVFLHNRWYIFELKTVSDLALDDMKYATIQNHRVVVPETFNTLPNQGHVDQASIYNGLVINMIQQGKLPLALDTFGGALLMYASRGELKIRSFCILPGTQAYTYYAGRIDTIDMLVKQKAPLNGTKKCSSRTSTYAKGCPFVDKCFPRKKATQS